LTLGLAVETAAADATTKKNAFKNAIKCGLEQLHMLSNRYVALSSDDPVISIAPTAAATTRDLTETPVVVTPAPQSSFWSQHGSEIIVGVIVAVASAVATYYAMKAVK